MVRVFGLSGLRNAYRSVLSAVGSSEISGASRCEEALLVPGDRRPTNSAVRAAPTTASRMNACFLRIRFGSFLTAVGWGLLGRGRRTGPDSRKPPDRFDQPVDEMSRNRSNPGLRDKGVAQRDDRRPVVTPS